MTDGSSLLSLSKEALFLLLRKFIVSCFCEFISNLYYRNTSKRHGGPGGRNTPSTCTARQEDNESEGGTGDKVLLARIAFYSNCPAKIEAKKINDGCMMVPRELGKLDLVHRAGKRITTDFTRNVEGSVCTLVCPKQLVTRKSAIDLSAASTGYIILNEELFMEPCNIGVDEQIILWKYGDEAWRITFESRSVDSMFEGLGTSHELVGVDKIIDEYGTEIFDMAKLSQIVVDVCNRPGSSCSVEFDLYTAYAEKRAERLATRAGQDRSDEVKKNMRQCFDSSLDIFDEDICEAVHDKPTPSSVEQNSDRRPK